MEGYKRILILSGILILPLLVWFGFNHSNSLISFVQAAYGAESNDDHSIAKADEHKEASTDDHSAIETTEKMTTGAANQHAPNTETEPGSILLPQKRTTLLSKTQLRGYASYQYYCAVCHGKGGGGNGSNAKNLSIPPRKHNDAPYMTNLSDAYLSRIIKEGGASQGLSPLMPLWEGTLSDGEILNLIAFLRILPDRQMMASAEEHQKSAGMGGHGHGGGGADDQHATEAGDHHGAGSDDHDAGGTEDHHADAAGDHKTATTNDHHEAEVDEHGEPSTDDHHATETDDHKSDGSDDNHADEADDHKVAGADDHNGAEVDEHMESSTDDHHGAEAGEHHEAGSEDNHTD